MAKDDALRDRLVEIASQDQNIRVQRLTAAQAKNELGLAMGGSSNPVYRFEIKYDGEAFDAIAFTSILNARNRPATRAEALGQAIAKSGAKLFVHSPFLLVFDFSDSRFMAVSAAKLFGAFANEAAKRDIPYADSATFSLTPSFDRKTVTMYAALADDAVWYCGDITALTPDELKKGLRQIHEESQAANIDQIVSATASRIAAAPVSDLPRTTELAHPAFLPVGGAGEDHKIELDSRIWRMIVNAIRSSPAVILVGPPGTGKTTLVRRAISHFARETERAGRITKEPLWATPDESWTTRDLVGGETIIEGNIAFRPGWVPRSIGEGRWLILDEANRADMDRIFGGLLTWLSGGRVAIGTETSDRNAREVLLDWSAGISSRSDTDDGRIIYSAGTDWRLIGTYNALDAQRVFRFGQALGRRFVRVPIPAATPETFSQILADSRGELAFTTRHQVAELYAAHYASESTLLGPALFIAMCDYLRVATDPAVEDDARDSNMETDPQELMAEAYIIHVGTWLAQLETADLDALEQRSLGNRSLAEKEWQWIRSMLGSLA
ncbi:AAA family ATPase [Ancylobacter defluvii]|uniref:AAA+ ATPase domain-containing protein n=1 Tax=Ancylobacter defluvii TaxID=1282440 RepID=A0A9W6JSB4_9HYPH|nr:AAA family ATPase [Ancylobacter defluvii]MBS7589802.1 AAA family ATPase [Ancylobacter defluvii]GLK82920.1 hypothetical protein GCM10017653_09890 [Ancylobacter defluvii]